MLDYQFAMNLRTIVETTKLNTYALQASDLKYQRFARVLPGINAQQYRLIAMQEGSVVLEDVGPYGGKVSFADQEPVSVTYENHFFTGGWQMHEQKFKDVDSATGIIGGYGINALNIWTADSTTKAAYQPQKLAMLALKNGEGTSFTTDNGHTFSLVGFDGLPIFHTAHPYYYGHASKGTFSNLLSGAAVAGTATSSGHPGFKPLAGPFVKNSGTGVWEYSAGASVSLQDGYDNLWDVITYYTGIKKSDGEMPGFLKPDFIFGSQKLRKQVTTILNAQFIGGNISTTGGSTEIAGTITTLGMNEPEFYAELNTGTASDYDWYLGCSANMKQDKVGAINLGTSIPWNVNLYTSATIPDLRVAKMVRAMGEMRSYVGAGQSKYILKNKAPTS
jgi:hypothetical protein